MSLAVNPVALQARTGHGSMRALRSRCLSVSVAVRSTRTEVVAMAGGFGKPSGPPKGKPLTKSAIKRNQQGDKFEEMAKDGKPVYAVFVRVAGPNQWFPVGPMTVENETSIAPAIFGAEKDLV
jgi:hypothetical protein